ncbi:hypothetical protein [Tibeticola sp.]|uniref:hypothetical protein n=1 Tax=Tibeticola sp. TaxID=2005368 RepID=UPI0025F703CE|nr:hypothetical protein [Tibeticola sp.]
MLRFIRRLLDSKAKPKIAHPVLGPLQLEQGKRGPYWLREAYADGELTLSIDAEGEAEPTEAQVAFFNWINSDLESIYSQVAPELSSRHQGMQRKPVDADWHKTFRLVGISVPSDGNKLAPWDITFECLTDNSGNLYTCYFERGALANVSVDT